jgi:type VI secretion system protein ImpK
MTPSTGATQATARPDNLALSFQEVFTAVERLRSNRQQLTDAETFRYHMREALKAAAQDARNRGGYNMEDIKMATLALVGFLDESILNSRNPIFADWPRKPLQEELFGIHMAGEVFFQNVEQLLGRNNSVDLADLLEVHYLCLLLGFTGRYSGARTGELQAVMAAIADKITRIRGPFGPLSPAWMPPEQVIATTGDPWVQRLMFAAIGSLVLMVVLFAIYKVTLGSGVTDLQVAAQRKA